MKTKIFIIIALLAVAITPLDVLASTLTEMRNSNVTNSIRGRTTAMPSLTRDMNNQAVFYFGMGNRVVYCSDKGGTARVNTSGFSSTSSRPSHISQARWDSIRNQLAFAYGFRGYVGGPTASRDTNPWRRFTQEYMYELLGATVHTSSVRVGVGGSTVSYADRRASVQTSVRLHNTRPTFNTTGVQLNRNQATTITGTATDSSAVLQRWTATATNGTVAISGGNLVVTATAASGNVNVTLTQRAIINDRVSANNIFFSRTGTIGGNRWQNFIQPGTPARMANVTLSIPINVPPPVTPPAKADPLLRVRKVDAEGKRCTNMKFEIRENAVDGNRVTNPNPFPGDTQFEFRTEEGTWLSPERLLKAGGTYFITEVNTLDPRCENRVAPASITLKNIDCPSPAACNVPEAQIDLLTFSNNLDDQRYIRVAKRSSENQELIKEMTFKIFDVANNRYLTFNDTDTFTTTNGEWASPSKLPMGNYIIREIIPPSGYVITNKEVPFEVCEDDRVECALFTFPPDQREFILVTLFNDPIVPDTPDVPVLPQTGLTPTQLIVGAALVIVGLGSVIYIKNTKVN